MERIFTVWLLLLWWVFESVKSNRHHKGKAISRDRPHFILQDLCSPYSDLNRTDGLFCVWIETAVGIDKSQPPPHTVCVIPFSFGLDSAIIHG